MLAAAAFAFYEAENSTVPADAPAQFQAGVIMGYKNEDVRALMLECFKPDQAMADETDAFFAALKSRDFSQIKDIIAQMEPKAISDASVCHTDDKYQQIDDFYSFQENLVKAAEADPDWQIHAIKDIRPHMADIKTGVAAAQTAWNLGTEDGYYQAGIEIGKIDKIVFAYWDKTTEAVNSTVPATAPAQFQAGFVMGFNGQDVRAEMVECFTPDQNLADHTDAFIQALKDHDWATIKSTITELEPEAV